jgi:hypothetical protein
MNATKLFKVNVDNGNTRKMKPKKVIKRALKGDPYYPSVQQTSSNPVLAAKRQAEMNSALIMNEIAKKINKDAEVYNTKRMQGETPEKLFFFNRVQEEGNQKLIEQLDAQGKALESTNLRITQMDDTLSRMGSDAFSMRETESGNFIASKKPPLAPEALLPGVEEEGAKGNDEKELDDLDENELDDLDELEDPETRLVDTNYYLNMTPVLGPSMKIVHMATSAKMNKNRDDGRRIFISSTRVKKGSKTTQVENSKKATDVTPEEIIERCNLYLTGERSEKLEAGKTRFVELMIKSQEESVLESTEVEKEKYVQSLYVEPVPLDDYIASDPELKSLKSDLSEKESEIQRIIKLNPMKVTKAEMTKANERKPILQGEIADIKSDIQSRTVHLTAKYEEREQRRKLDREKYETDKERDRIEKEAKYARMTEDEKIQVLLDERDEIVSTRELEGDPYFGRKRLAAIESVLQSYGYREEVVEEDVLEEDEELDDNTGFRTPTEIIGPVENEGVVTNLLQQRGVILAKRSATGDPMLDRKKLMDIDDELGKYGISGPMIQKLSYPVPLSMIDPEDNSELFSGAEFGEENMDLEDERARFFLSNPDFKKMIDEHRRRGEIYNEAALEESTPKDVLQRLEKNLEKGFAELQKKEAELEIEWSKKHGMYQEQTGEGYRRPTIVGT